MAEAAEVAEGDLAAGVEAVVADPVLSWWDGQAWGCLEASLEGFEGGAAGGGFCPR